MPRPIPLRADVLVHPFDKPILSQGGIYMAPQEQIKHKSKNGIVVALGPACSDDLSIGDHVCFNGYSGDKVTTPNGIFLLIPEALIEAKIENSDVKLFDSETVKRLIDERVGEIQLKDPRLYLTDLRNSLFERLDSFTYSEGYEF